MCLAWKRFRKSVHYQRRSAKTFTKLGSDAALCCARRTSCKRGNSFAACSLQIRPVFSFRRYSTFCRCTHVQRSVACVVNGVGRSLSLPMPCHVLSHRVMSGLVCLVVSSFFLTGRYDEMSTVLQRMTNAPVNLPPELLAGQRPVRRKGSSFSTRWKLWRYSLGGGAYHRVSGRLSDDGTDNISAMADPEEEGSSDRYGHKKHVCAGVKQVLCPGNDARLRRSTTVLVVVWFTLSYASYGVATWNNQLFADVGLSNPYLCSFIYSLSTLPGNVGSIILVERVS